jgi:putative lipoprotein
VPVRCNAEMPVKPKDDGTFETDKRIAIYYRDCEKKLKQCLGIKEEDGK